MTTIEAPPPPAEHVGARSGPEGAWRLGWSGVRTVAVLELRQRVRSTRWLIVLGVWVAVLGVLTLLIRHAVYSAVGPGEPPVTGTDLDGAAQRLAGATLFGIIVFLVLSLGGAGRPGAHRDQRQRRPGRGRAGDAADHAAARPRRSPSASSLAAWVTALALLVAASPFLVWAYVDGGTPAGRLATTLAVLALTLLVVCAIGLGWSARRGPDVVLGGADLPHGGLPRARPAAAVRAQPAAGPVDR